jgi:hypothetical protein
LAAALDWFVSHNNVGNLVICYIGQPCARASDSVSQTQAGHRFAGYCNAEPFAPLGSGISVQEATRCSARKRLLCTVNLCVAFLTVKRYRASPCGQLRVLTEIILGVDMQPAMHACVRLCIGYEHILLMLLLGPDAA